MLPCHCKPKIYLRFFEVCTYPSIHNFIFSSRLPPCNAISECRPLLSNTNSEAGALPLEVRIENDLDRIFFKLKLVHSFLENHFSPRFMLPCHCKQKIYFWFFEVCTYPSIPILDSRLPPCNAISEGRPPLSNTSSETEALALEVRIENDSDRIF